MGMLAWTIFCLILGALYHRRMIMEHRTFAKDAIFVPLARLLDSSLYAMALFMMCTFDALRPGLLVESGVTAETYPIIQGMFTGCHMHVGIIAFSLIFIVIVTSIKLESIAF